MRDVQGIGGVFLYARDAEALARWYEQHLGLSLNAWGASYGCELPSRDLEETGRRATTTFAIFSHDDPASMQSKTARINFRVPDVKGLRDRLQAAGVRIRPEEEVSPYGHFVSVYDPEDNRVELWQPPLISEGWPEEE